MENIRSWFKEGTSEEEKENIQEIVDAGIEQKDDNLNYEIDIHNKMKDLITALDTEDMETVSKLFPQTDKFLMEEQERLTKKRDDAVAELEEIKDSLLKKEIKAEDAVNRVKELTYNKEQWDKKFAYLQPLAKEIKDKMLSLYKKMSGEN